MLIIIKITTTNDNDDDKYSFSFKRLLPTVRLFRTTDMKQRWSNNMDGCQRLVYNQ